MLKRSILVLGALVSACASPVEPLVVELPSAPSAPSEPSTDLEQAAVQIWALDAQHGHCGGFLLGPSLLVTAAHCIPSGSSDVLFRRLGTNRVESAHVAYINRAAEHDIAYLSADDESSAHISSRALHEGEHGTLLRPLWGTRISGIVEMVQFQDGLERAVLWGTGAHGGDSGSPVVADDGAVIGIVSSGVWIGPGHPITGVTLVPVPIPPWQVPR